MAFVDQFLDRFGAAGDCSISSERERLLNRPISLVCADSHRMMLLAPSENALNNELVNGVKVTSLKFFLNQSFRLGLDVDRHITVGLAVKAVNLIMTEALYRSQRQA
jgi:hypothetical protein